MTLKSGLNVNGRFYEVKYGVSKSLSSGVRINGGVVFVKLSRFLKGSKRDETVEKFLSWAGKRLAKARPDSFISPIYEDGGRVCTHNKIYEIFVLFDDGKTARSSLRDGHFIDIRLPVKFKMVGELSSELEEKVKFLSEKIIMKDRLGYLREVLDELNQLYFRGEFSSCRFKRASSRFGSCSTKKNINISYRLLFAPKEVFRYVCAHELAHLSEFNHSKKFWALVEEAVPDYKKHEDWLRRNGFLLG